jgi:glycosyltransferase involved in cell wall biosynthesis
MGSVAKKHIISPMATGNGAYIVHRLLENHLPEYRVSGYHPNWTFLPFLLPKVASTYKASLIHTTPDYAIFFHRKSLPLVISFQNYVLDDWMSPYSSWIQRLHYSSDLRLWTLLAVKKAHAITAVSEFTARLARQDLNISQPIEIIYNSVDADIFAPQSFSNKTQKDIRVFYSGNLTRRKGATLLPAIAAKLQKNIRIFYTQGLRTRNTLPSVSNLHPIGLVPFEEMPNRYNQMDILLMPTVREGLSLAVLEAMACGLPVVASDCSSLPEQIDNRKGGFLCPVGDVDAFAAKINLLADSPKLRKEMGQYNRSKVKRMYTLEGMVKKYQTMFEKILSKRL